MSDSSEQEYLGSEGSFCPIFGNPEVKDPNIIGKTRGIRSVGLPADMLEQLGNVREIAGKSGVKLKKAFEK